MTPADVARIVEHREDATFVALLRAADPELEDPAFCSAVVEVLRTHPDLRGHWQTWSEDQRWTPTAYLEGCTVGWYDERRQHVVEHADAATAAADLIRRLAAWVARRVVLTAD